MQHYVDMNGLTVAGPFSTEEEAMLWIKQDDSKIHKPSEGIFAGGYHDPSVNRTYRILNVVEKNEVSNAISA
jgi:hypothetical protein